MNKAGRKRKTKMYVTALEYYGINQINGYSLYALTDDVLRKRLLEEKRFAE